MSVFGGLLTIPRAGLPPACSDAAITKRPRLRALRKPLESRPFATNHLRPASRFCVFGFRALLTPKKYAQANKVDFQTDKLVRLAPAVRPDRGAALSVLIGAPDHRTCHRARRAHTGALRHTTRRNSMRITAAQFQSNNWVSTTHNAGSRQLKHPVHPGSNARVTAAHLPGSHGDAIGFELGTHRTPLFEAKR